MFLSKETRFIRPLLFRDLMRWPACQNTADCTALVAVQNRLPLWIISLALEAGECILAGNIRGLMDYHTMLVCMDLFFSVCKWLFSASWRNILRVSWGFAPRTSPGLPSPRSPASAPAKPKSWIRHWRFLNMHCELLFDRWRRYRATIDCDLLS